MTYKQLMSSIKSTKADLAHSTKAHEEMLRERGWSAYEKEIAYYTKRIAELEAMIPEALRIEEEKMLKKIAKEQLKGKASTIGYIKKGNDIEGITPNGKRWWAEHNWWGNTERTLHCYTLKIAGQGVIFTSGTLETVLMTVAQN